MNELDIFSQVYEQATNSHDFEKVKPLIADDAVYWFSDGSFNGIEAIEKAFNATWERIQNETYSITNVRWISKTDNLGVCLYEFHWGGDINGNKLSGSGRSTNVISKLKTKWQMTHEHLKET
jgi:ketosteroid isomerase-like protein